MHRILLSALLLLGIVEIPATAFEAFSDKNIIFENNEFRIEYFDGDNDNHLGIARPFIDPQSKSDNPEIPEVFQKGREGENVQNIGNQPHLESEPTSIVNNCVNVISGAFINSEVDFVVPGPEPLYIHRNYVSSDSMVMGPIGQGWNRNHFGEIYQIKDPDGDRRYCAWVIDSGGSTACFSGSKKLHYYMLPFSYRSHVTNCGSGMISGRTNIKNHILISEDEKRIICKGSGDRLTYLPLNRQYWHLTDEEKPNGNKLHYSYYRSDDQLGKIEVMNKDGRIFDQLDFTYGREKNERSIFAFIKHQGKQKAAYRYMRLKGKNKGKRFHLVEAIRESGPPITYQYRHDGGKESISKLSHIFRPDGRFQWIDYYMKGKNWIGEECVELKEKNKEMGRVSTLYAPVGADKDGIITHKFFYSNLYETGSFTKVLDAYDHRTDYHWDSDERLIEVNRFKGTHDYNKYSVERLYWGDVKSQFCTFLLLRTCEAADGNVHYARAFKYDDRGNILAEETYGNLSGKNSSPCEIANNEVIQNGCECHVKHYEYSNDGRNLMKLMRDGSVTETYEYKDGTDLLSAKFWSQEGKIFKREFYWYDENAVLNKKIEDDGDTFDASNLQGATERHIRYTQLRNIFPIGLPEMIHDQYIDIKTGQEHLLKKSVYEYSESGLPVSKSIYDSQNQLMYTLTWEHDNYGNIVRETNAIGQETIRCYDANCNLISEQNSGQKYDKNFVYDFSNRLIRVDECHYDGIVLSEFYKYNYLSQKIASTDIFGNETQYKYDEFGRLVETILPPVVNEAGELVTPRDYTEYNIFNVPSLYVDFKGNTTSSECTIRGKPTRTLYADGSMEEILYNLNGTTNKIVHRNGTYTCFEYDYLKRPVSKSTFDAQGSLLQSLKYKYNAFHLLSETDASGNEKSYKYDAAGYLIEVRKGESKISYEHDSLGRVYKTTEFDGEGDCVIKIQKFDLLDRVIEERNENKEGNVLTKVTYGFDVSGNRNKVTTYTDKEKFTIRITHDSRGQPIKIVDPAKAVTHIKYKFDYRNAFGQNVPYVQTTDSMGNITEEIKDTQGRVVTKVQKNSSGALLHKKEIFYDKNGNRCRQIDTVTKQPDKIVKQIISEMTYDCMNRVVAISEAVGSSDQKQIQFIYNDHGEKSEIIKADGVRLKNSFDLLGRLKEYSSSDKTVHYVYTYDQNGNLIKIHDKIAKQDTLRTYDTCDRLVHEILANGLAIKYTYDGANRPRMITFPDKSGVEYIYKAHRLMAVHRLSEEKKRLYTHRYVDYDLEDKLISSKLIGNVGKAKFSYDKVGRPTKLHYVGWKEHIRSYDSVGNILKREIEDPLGKTSCNYLYDDLYQVVQENGIALHSYAFDSLHNRISKDKKKMSVNDLNQILNDSKVRYSYNLNGNLKKITSPEGKVIFKYDALDRLTEVLTDKQRVCYTYDAQNRRLTKRVDTKTNHKKNWSLGALTNFLYVGENEIGSYDDRGVAQELRLIGLAKGAELGGAVALELNGQVFAPAHDYLGNVTALIDAKTANLVEAYRYSAFGEEEIIDGEGNSIATSVNPWRFSSKRVDNETGFVYFGQRYYNPTLGRWISPDPIGRAGGPNPYAYVLNKPLTSFDAYGLFGERLFESRPHHSDVGPIVRQHFQFGDRPEWIKNIGDRMESVAFQIPIPFVRDVWQCYGRVISGKGFDDFYFTFCGTSISGNLGLPEKENFTCLTTGGNYSFKSDMESRAQVMSEAAGGSNAHYFCKSSDGVLLDAFTSFISKNVLYLPSDIEYSRFVKNLTDQVGANGIVETECFSHGAILTENCYLINGTDSTKRMNVNNYGGGAVLNKQNYFDAINYFSERDPVPIVSSPFRCGVAKFFPRNDVIFLKSNNSSHDHSWDCQTYQEAIELNHRKLH